MYRVAVRTASRQTLGSLRLAPAQRRMASSAVKAGPRTWKGTALRWGLAIGAVYYYNTSSVFADEMAPQPVPAPSAFADSSLQTVDSVIEQKRKQLKAKQPSSEPKEESKEGEKSKTQSQNTAALEGSPEALEEEAGQEGAFNPETGEINWDCPCLGGMADGPCGEQFKAAFSCFVYSTEEPKGMECIEKFQGMQECFREYPEIYAAELSDEEDGEQPAPETSAEGADKQAPAPEPTVEESSDAKAETKAERESGEKPKPVLEEVKQAEPAFKEQTPIPKAWEDATDANEKADKE